MMWRCRNCLRRYDWTRVHPTCPACGGPLDREAPIVFHPEAERSDAPGLWRYVPAMHLPMADSPVTLGEGRTPLQPVHLTQGRQVFVKREDLNPTGSVKDRAASVLFTWAREQGVEEVVTLATPNTLRSWRRYAARARLRVRAYGVTGMPSVRTRGIPVRRFPGTWWETMTALHRQETTVLVPYHPLAVDAYATIAYELVAQLGGAPGTVLAPVGQGALLLGIGRGFLALLQAGLIATMPRLVGVEPLARAGLWARAKGGREAHLWVRDEAPGPAVEAGRRFPWWGDLLLELVAWSQGRFLAVDDEAWARARDAFRRVGLYLQPESVLVWAGWAMHQEEWPEPVVLILPGGKPSLWQRIGRRFRLRIFSKE